MTTAADPELVQTATGLLQTFNAAGVLGPADVHTATAIARMGGESDDRVRLALALTVRALRTGSVCVDLETVHATVFDEAEEELDVSDLPWPVPGEWLAACEDSSLVSVGIDPDGNRPLRLVDGLLYLERYWGQQEIVRTSLQTRLGRLAPEMDLERLRTALDRLFTGADLPAGEPDRQARAAAVSGLRWLTVLTGGPGTGKTTTVARLLALLRDQPGRPPRIALAAPTGKAAARLEEAVRSAAAELDPSDQERLGDLTATTLHRLLGWLPGHRTRFRHDADAPLPHDIVVVDEMSMVSLTLMARLLDAVRPDARLVLVGDPDQLSSVEAGAVLADVARAPGAPDAELGSTLRRLAVLPAAEQAPVHGVVQLTHTWRFGGGIATLAEAIRRADADAVLEALRGGTDEVGFVETDRSAADGSRRDSGADADPLGALQLVRHHLSELVVTAGRETRSAAQAGDVVGALAGLDRHRLLCAHRRGPYGVQRWSLEVERWLAEHIPGYASEGEFYPGRPLLITTNDYELGLYNGDTGVIVTTGAGPRAAFGRGAAPTLFAPARLDALVTLHAMTVHRAQGSQFGTVSVLLPPVESPLLTRELLYTAVTRATQRVLILGTEAAVRRAVARPANRASGLRSRLAAEPADP